MFFLGTALATFTDKNEQSCEASCSEKSECTGYFLKGGSCNLRTGDHAKYTNRKGITFHERVIAKETETHAYTNLPSKIITDSETEAKTCDTYEFENPLDDETIEQIVKLWEIENQALEFNGPSIFYIYC